MQRTVLITGGAGFIGSFVADRLLSRGDRVRLLDRLDPQVHPQGPPEHLPREAEFRVADVRDKVAVLDALAGVDVVVHCAAAVGVAQSLYRVQHFIDANVGGTAVLLEALAERREAPVRLIIPTSMTGYGEGVYRRPSDGGQIRIPIRTREEVSVRGWEPVDPESGEVVVPAPTPEDAALLATNVYALSKRYQEELALALGRTYGFPVTCLRLFNVYGPRQSLSNPYTGVLAIFLSRLLAGHPPVVYEDGLQSRDFVSVHDVARAIELAIETPACAGRVINVGSGEARAIGEVARILARLVGRDDLVPEIRGEFRSGDVRHCVADTRLARRLLGFSPTVRWEEGLAEVVEWARRAPAEDAFARAAEELRAHGLVS